MMRIALLVTLLAACGKDNPYFCDDACQMMPDADVGPGGCETNDDCSDTTPVCDTTDGVCVACTAADNGSCGNKLCSTTHECQRCVSHDECTASDACNASSGECVDTAMVAYVATTGSNSNPCTMSLPCATLTYAATQKPFVKLQNNITETVSFQNATVTVLAEPQTVIARLTGNDGAVVTVSGTSNIVLTNVVITGGATPTGHGILVGSAANVNLTLESVTLHTNTGLGLSIGGGTLTMSRCLVSNNYGGGADINANFDITNSMFVANGTGGSTFGGLRLLPGLSKRVFSFNTVANNMSNDAPTAGINCSQSMTISTTLVANNATNLCAFQSSMFDTSTTHVGTNDNIVGVPAFKYINASMPLSADFYRLGSTSDAIDAAQGTPAVTFDIDGDARPQTGADIGADEYK